MCLAESRHSEALNSIISLAEGAGHGVSAMTGQPRTIVLCVQLSVLEYRGEEVSVTGRGACEMPALFLKGSSLDTVMLLFLYCWKVVACIAWFVQGRFLEAIFCGL